MITIDQINTNYISIKNRKQFLTEIPYLQPGTPQYENFWAKETIKCIEGVWGYMDHKYRYMSGPLYFYINYGAIKVTDNAKNTYFVKPYLRTLEWEYAYMMLEARGFSGFSEDEEYTSYEGYLEGQYEIKDLDGNVIYSCYNKNGDLKKYRTPKEAIRMLHEEPLGIALFYNQSRDVMFAGSRGGRRRNAASNQ